MSCHIPFRHGALEYTSVNEAIDHIFSMGRGCILVKRDLAEAFRHIPVSEADWWLLGFSWDGNYYLERYLPFSLRTAPFIFDLFAKSLDSILMDAGWQTIHYLDSFLAILERGPDIDPDKYKLFFYYMCYQLYLSINIKRKCLRNFGRVSRNRTGHGLDRNSSLPKKLFKAKKWIARILDKQTITRQDL